MTPDFLTLTKDNIESEHICCAFSDKKCSEGYQMKKNWLKKEFENGHVFHRLNERAKVFIEYVPSEKAWLPVHAPDTLMINCFWVSGHYKGKGYAKALLQKAHDAAVQQKKTGLVTVTGTKKFHFMSDSRWFLKQGFEIVETLPNGFSLLFRKIGENSLIPSFRKCVQTGECPDKDGLVAYYSNRCPFTEYHLRQSLVETAKNHHIPLKINKLNTMEEAQNAPTPATIFSLFYNGKFVTTDISVCMNERFSKAFEKWDKNYNNPA